MFNTLQYARRLEATGISRDQAEAHVQIMAEIVEDELATKADLKDLGIQLRAEISTLRTELKSEIGELRNDMQKSEYRIVIKLSAIVGAMMTLAIGATATLIKTL